eukprot:6822646-Heterocapsa_arctica.AAC.1
MASSGHPYLRWGMASSPEPSGQQLTLDGGGFVSRSTPGGARSRLDLDKLWVYFPLECPFRKYCGCISPGN